MHILYLLLQKCGSCNLVSSEVNALYRNQQLDEILNSNLKYVCTFNSRYLEAATVGVLLKKVFLKISQNSQEKTCARAFFLNKVINFILKRTLAQVFSCEFCEISRHTFFTEHLWATASGYLQDHPEASFIYRRPLHIEVFCSFSVGMIL